MAFPIPQDILALRGAIGIQASGFDDLTDRDYAELMAFSRCGTYTDFAAECKKVRARYPTEQRYDRIAEIAFQISHTGIDDGPHPDDDAPGASVRIYAPESCLLHKGVRIERRPTADEVAAYLSHPATALVQRAHWLHSLFAGPRKRFDGYLSDEQIAAVHPDHAHLISKLRVRPGRPTLPAGTAKSARVELLTTPERAALAQACADAAGMSRNQWIEGAIDAQAAREAQ